MQDNELGNGWVRSDISWCNPWIIVNESMSVPSDYMSSGHHDLDIAWKPPNIIAKDSKALSQS